MKRAPRTNLISGPNAAAEADPTKKSPGTEDWKCLSRVGKLPVNHMPERASYPTWQIQKTNGLSRRDRAAGTGERGTGIPSWEAKLDVEDHMRRIELPVTSLRPEAFMELMTDTKYYPSVGTWLIWPRISGEDKGIAWLAVEDVGVVAGSVFGRP